jgi:hypothetical protein
MHASVHTNGITRTSFDAVPAEDATEFVDDEALRVLLVTFTLLVSGIISGLNVNALRRTSRRATEAGHTTWRPIRTLCQTMDTSKTLRVGAFLFRIADRIDPFRNRLKHWIVASAENHVLGVPKCIAYCLTQPLDDFGYIALDGRTSFRRSHHTTLHLVGSEPRCIFGSGFGSMIVIGAAVMTMSVLSVICRSTCGH